MSVTFLCRIWVCISTIMATKWISNTKTMLNSFVNPNDKHKLFMSIKFLRRFWVCVPTIRATKWISNTKTTSNSLLKPKRKRQTFRVSKIFVSILNLRPYHKRHNVDIEHKKQCRPVCVNPNDEHKLFMSVNFLCRIWVCVHTIRATKWI